MDSSLPPLRILPGQWRPQCVYEQIAWVSPAWPSADHIWLDYPEAVFVRGELLYLSHDSERFPHTYTDLPKVPWQPVEGGMTFTRELPNGMVFTGTLTRADDKAVAMELTFTNNSSEAMTDILLQTCAYVRQIRELSDHSHRNVCVHTAADGWVAINHALEHPAEDGRVHLGWREGPKTCDWPLIACTSQTAPRGVAMTWFDHTLSLIGNPEHPCFHADPFVADLDPGATDTLRGVLLFFEGDVADLDFQRDLARYA